MADRDPTPVQPPDIPIASAQARSEIEEYLEVSQQRHKLFPRAAVVGLLAGSVAVLFRYTAPFDALVQVLEGEAEITIAGKPHRMQGGEMILMPANQPHALKALKRYKMIFNHDSVPKRES